MSVFEDLAKAAEDPRIPDNTRLIEAMGKAGIGASDAYTDVFTALTDTKNAFSDRRSDAFIAELNAAPNKAARDAMLTDKLSGFNLLNPKMLHEAMAKAETRDLARSADKLARDTFGLEQEKFAETKEENIQDTIDKINERAMLENQFNIEQDLKQEQFDAKQTQTAFLNAAATAAVTREIAKTAEVNRITKRKEDREDIIRAREDKKFRLGENLRALTLKAQEAEQKISLRKSKQSEEDIAVIRPARIALLNVITNPDSTVTQNAAAVRVFSKAVGGRPIGKETRDLIKTVLTRAQGLELDEFNEGYNVIDANPDSPTYGTSETQRLLLDVINTTRGTNYKNLGEAEQKDYSAQVKKNFIKALSKIQSKHIKGRKTARELRPAATEVLADNVEASTIFASEAKKVETRLKMEDITVESLLKEYSMNEDDRVGLADDPQNYIADRVSRRIKTKHGDAYDAFDQTELELIVKDSVKTLRGTLNFDKLTKQEQLTVNLGILKYLDGMKYYPGWKDNFNDFELGGKEYSTNSWFTTKVKPHEMLNDLQMAFPPNSKIAKALKKAAPGKPKGDETEKDDFFEKADQVDKILLDNLTYKDPVDQYRINKGEPPFQLKKVIPDLLGVSEADLAVKHGNAITRAAQVQALEKANNEEKIKVLKEFAKYNKDFGTKKGNYKPNYQKKTPPSQFYR